MIELLKKIVFKEKYNSKTYIDYLNRRGATVSSKAYIVSPRKTLIDTTRPYLLKIGDYVTITEGVSILTHGFDWSVLKVKYGELLGSAGGVTIKNNVFIGVNSTILKGVTIGENTIIGAGSVVTKDIPSNVVAVGNPCRVICSIEEYFKKREVKVVEEAKMLIREYFKKNNRLPPKEELAEFIWLFASENEILENEVFRKKMEYGGNMEDSLTVLKNRRKIVSYEKLCMSALDELCNHMERLDGTCAHDVH